MEMRETVRSLRAYFIFSGLAGLFFGVSTLQANLLGTAIGAIIGLISIGFSLAFVYVGFTLPKLLRVSANRIVMLLYASTAWTVFSFLLSLLGGPPSVFALVALVVTLLILWYLLKNVRRLAAEVQAAPSEAPRPGPIE